ncbi:retrovirus-related pol polyprotein from transposon TNT 1-94 [Tanacetum coccineum]
MLGQFRVVNVVRVNQAKCVKASTMLGKPQQDDTGFVDSGCSRHMTGNIAYLSDFKEFDGGYVTFGGGVHGGRISDNRNHLKLMRHDFEDDNMYNFDMKNVVPKESLTCLVAKATSDESMLWHRRLGHIIFKNMNKLVKDNLVRGLPTKRFENDQTFVTCLKGKQHRAFCNSKVLNPITKPLFMLHMVLFGPTFVSSLMHKKEKGIKREYSVARTPQQNGVAKRRNRTLIEAAKTIGFKPALSFMRPFGCHVTILNTLDSLGKFDGKSDEGTISNESAGTQGELNAGTSEEISQDCIVMPIWKDASYFDSPTQDVDNGEPKSVADDQKQDGDDPDNEKMNKISLMISKLNTVDPSVNTASSYYQDNLKDMFTMEASHTLEATHVEFFSDEDEPEVDLGNIANSYTIKPISIAKALSDSSWVEAMHEELLQFKLQQVWILVDLPIGKRAIGTNWVFRNKKDERGIVIRNKARLVAQGHRQEALWQELRQ